MKSFYSILSFFIFCSYLIYGCKKEIPFAQFENTNIDKLTGDTAIFVGTWSWVYTDHYYGWCDNESHYEYLDPVSENVQFKLQFSQNGHLKYLKNDTLISVYRIVFDYFDFNSEQACGVGAKQFSIDLDGYDDLGLSGCVFVDTLKCHIPGFIFYEEEGCENYVNYFVKE